MGFPLIIVTQVSSTGFNSAFKWQTRSGWVVRIDFQDLSYTRIILRLSRVLMKLFWVEGVFVPKNGGGRKMGSASKPFSQSFWARTPVEAIQAAVQSIPGARWIEGPVIAEKSEEQRMRAMGAPELPGLGTLSKNKKAGKK